MTTAPQYKGALPQPTPESKPYWDALKQHKLLLPKCKKCGPFFYPRPFCPTCFRWDIEWAEMSGKGVIYTFIINHRPPPAMGDKPIILAVVELAEGPRMMTNIVGIDPDPAKLWCGMPVEVAYYDVTPEFTFPKFKPSNPNQPRPVPLYN
jgi:uncharacterized OB-fold protein